MWKIGYIIHTEKLENDEIFDLLLRFCSDFEGLFGVKALCTVIPPTSIMRKFELESAGFNVEYYGDRIRELSNIADIGYHGHFWMFEGGETRDEILGMRGRQYICDDLISQFQEDCEWFISEDIDHGGRYAGGWNFTNWDVSDLLIKHGFQYDFSFSHSTWFSTEFSARLFKTAGIKPGQAFEIVGESGSLKCVQNLFGGCRDGSWWKLLYRVFRMSRFRFSRVRGVFNSHDYDLTRRPTLDCLRRLRNLGAAEILHCHSLWDEGSSMRVPFRFSSPGDGA